MTYATSHSSAGFEGPGAGFIGGAGLVVLLWLGAVVVLGGAGAFQAEAGEPPLATLTALVLPPLAFLLLLRVPGILSSVLAVDPIWLTAMQGLRILGVGFLFVYAFGHLPGLFAHIAGWGDLLVAALAPVVVARLAADRGFLRSPMYFGFHVLGLLDFVGAVGAGLVARGTIPLLGMSESTSALGQLPLLMIPCFAVPLWICFHIAAFAQIGASRRAARH
ncbi:hypothetical protein HW532_08730 [Kaustia mangrovi]|uniref:Uncharacterized protein n=1 Tax=Kaustia mangrovi TaxID=2593653 RepID=A0A7S8C3L9_9HYPH|nr:hypothetical protein [Kaustia mangrovi]QPC42773.1 hypothetical protein HW532_08730 [Kaustia mangrovi]